MSARLIVALTLLALLPACAGQEHECGPDAAPSSDCVECLEQPAITYDTFGRGFLSAYCDGCHGSAVEDRRGAPLEVVFDTREGASAYGERILARVAPADGSAATMPPAGGIAPADAERLAIWLSCFPE